VAEARSNPTVELRKPPISGRCLCGAAGIRVNVVGPKRPVSGIVPVTQGQTMQDATYRVGIVVMSATRVIDTLRAIDTLLTATVGLPFQ
jgi:hypothetical protein